MTEYSQLSGFQPAKLHHCLYMELEQTILLVLGLISMLMYTLIYVLLKKFKTKGRLVGPFFQIVMKQYFVALIYFIEFTVTMRIRKYSEAYEMFDVGNFKYPWVARLCSAIHYYIKMVVYMGYMHFASNRLLAANRISSLDNDPNNLKIMKLWTYLQWLIPLLGILPTHAVPFFTFDYIVTTSTIRLINDSVSTQLIAYIDGLYSLFACIFCLFCFGFTISVLRKQFISKSENSGNSSQMKSKSKNRAEKNLLVTAVISFCVLMLNTILQVSKIITSWFGVGDILTVYDFSYPLNDLMFSHFPWVLLATSSTLRQEIKFHFKNQLNKLLSVDNTVGASRQRVITVTSGRSN